MPQMTIGQLNNWCAIHNFSISFDKKKNVNGIKKFDYIKSQQIDFLKTPPKTFAGFNTLNVLCESLGVAYLHVTKG